MVDLACTRTTGRDLSAYPCGPVSKLPPYASASPYPAPLVVADLTEHRQELSVPHSSAKSTALCILLRVLGGARPRLNGQTHLHFGVSRHGEAVEAVGDDSQAGSDQHRCSVGLGPECFEGSVEPGGLVRLRTTRRDDDQHPGAGDHQAFGDVSHRAQSSHQVAGVALEVIDKVA